MQSDPPIVPEQKPKRRVLLVEDNEAAGKGLAKLLQAQGFEVTTVRDGAAALALLASGAPPDVLLTDMQLPDIDGREVARQARLLVPPPRTVLITGWDIEPEHDDTASWGIDWVLTKPVDINELLEKLAQPLPPASDEA
jgi:CheY-like chemotaxis protein